MRLDALQRFKTALVFLSALAAWAALPARAAQYEIDPAHAFIEFRVSHLGFSEVVGRFNRFAGNFTWDKENPAGAAIEVTVDTASVDSNWAERDKHLRGEDFLDVDRFPQAVFKSTRYLGDAKGGKMEGTLTLRGVTRPIVLDVSAVGEGPDPWGGYRAGFTATTAIDKRDFGIDFDLGPTGNAVNFHLVVEGIRK